MTTSTPIDVNLNDVEEQRASIELSNRQDLSNASLKANVMSEGERLLSGSVADRLSARTGDCNIFQRICSNIDERVSVKLLVRIWGPRLEFLIRVMLVATFLDDSVHTARHFPEHAEQVGRGWCLAWLAALSPTGATVVAGVLLGAGILAQFVGSIFLLTLIQPDVATKALIGWVVVQPLLYGQVSNWELMSESISLIGGLMLLRAHLLSKQPLAASEATSNSAAVQLLGRLFLPAAYLYRAGSFFAAAFTLDETTNLGMYLSSLSIFAVNVIILVGLLAGSALVATGLRSRTVAIVLAVINIVFTFSQHPFFRFLYRAKGEWQVDETAIWMPNVAVPSDGSGGNLEFDPWEAYDLHRYYFFLGLSTSGALLLLAQLGPGDIAVQKDEKLLPVVARAED